MTTATDDSIVERQKDGEEWTRKEERSFSHSCHRWYCFSLHCRASLLSIVGSVHLLCVCTEVSVCHSFGLIAHFYHSLFSIIFFLLFIFSSFALLLIEIIVRLVIQAVLLFFINIFLCSCVSWHIHFSFFFRLKTHFQWIPKKRTNRFFFCWQKRMEKDEKNILRAFLRYSFENKCVANVSEIKATLNCINADDERTARSPHRISVRRCRCAKYSPERAMTKKKMKRRK